MLTTKMNSLRATLVLGLVFGLGPAVSAQNEKALAKKHHMTEGDVDRMVKELSNWGRWGKQDRLGALNLITPKKRQAAAKLVEHGVSVSLARNVETETALDNPDPFQHKMLRYGRGMEGKWASDNFSVAYHGYAHTHMDSLCHLFYKGKMYNGFSKEDVGPMGADKVNILDVKGGIFTRGVLIDVPLLRGVQFLDPGTAIFPEDLDAWEEFANVKIQPGDVVFIRTGRWLRRDKVGPWDVKTAGAAGLHASCAKWLKDRDIAMLGSDGASDVLPSQIEGVSHPVHVLTLHAMGVHIFDNCDLLALSKTAQKMKRWHFLLTASPLPVKGGTGSPLNPIATY